MFDDLFERIRVAAPSLMALTNEETAILEAWLGDHPEPPSSACSEEQRGILSVWEETAPADRDWWTLLRATLKHNQGRIVPADAGSQPTPAVTTPGGSKDATTSSSQPAATVEAEKEVRWESDPAWQDLTPQAKRILRFMHDKASTTLDTFAEEIWGDGDGDNRGKIGAALNRANHALNLLGERRTLVRPRGESVVRWE